MKTPMQMLIEKIRNTPIGEINNIDFTESLEHEKKEIMVSYEQGRFDEETRFPEYENSEQYYNETFKND